MGVETGERRVLRGGSWINNGRNARSAYRNHDEPGNRNDNIGFRLALARRLSITHISNRWIGYGDQT
ncbi:MAG: SUMF1/EgtB/PvdO family nonheme iron enzyme, partial [Candidatus Contendobacter sp.]|nr:SUMF1/EgtB/PvdO family nonheme iron enzyme [Candidatus Contendobacter sp.]MDG4558043.1 SUMF1/EgtB/PvdO family nonheme iron enzyme [Candidatus Contendobacter sp.]